MTMAQWHEGFEAGAGLFGAAEGPDGEALELEGAGADLELLNTPLLFRLEIHSSPA